MDRSPARGLRGHLRVTPPEPRVLAPRALVADDDLKVRSTMVRMIQSLGFTCLEAGSGEEALALLENEGEVPLVISDINMPGMDGLGLLEGVLARYPDTAVIMLSGVAEVKTAVSCLEKGALDYLQKPAMLEEVRARVLKALEKRELLLQRRFYQKNLERRVRSQATRISELFLEPHLAVYRRRGRGVVFPVFVSGEDHHRGRHKANAHDEDQNGENLSDESHS